MSSQIEQNIPRASNARLPHRGEDAATCVHLAGPTGLPEARNGRDAPGAEDDVELPLDRPLSELVSEYERSLIDRALKATRGNRSKAAKLLHTTERIIGYRVQQYGIDCKVYRD